MTSNQANSGEFYANRHGGDASEIISNGVIFGNSSVRSKHDIQFPRKDKDGSMYFQFDADEEAEFIAVGNWPKDTLFKLQETVGAEASQLRNSGRSLRGKARRGQWRIALPNVGDLDAKNSVLIVQHEQSNIALETTLEAETLDSGTKINITCEFTGLENTSELNSFQVEVQLTPLSGDKKIVRIQEMQSMDDCQTKMILDESGVWDVLILASAKLNGGVVARSSSHSFHVSPIRLRVGSDEIYATQGIVIGETVENDRYGLPVWVEVISGTIPKYVRSKAEIWAVNRQGDDVPVGWIGGLMQPLKDDEGKWRIPLSFHIDWTKKGDYQLPISLRNLKIRDIGTGDQILVSHTEIPIQGMYPKPREKFESKPTKEMLHGARLFESEKSPRISLRTLASRGDVLFLDGWCSSGLASWMFDNTIQGKVYRPRSEDHNDGQTSEERAIAIMKENGWRPGLFRGAVAHSHGGLVGAVLLNDFSYVFMDNASSAAPNLVSMGSPYNGSYLADHTNNEIAKILQIAGIVGDCKAPWDLKKSQNYLWQAEIGWRAKYQISGWMTTHKKYYSYRPDRWDRCGLGSLLIGNTDDGVVGKTEARGFADNGDYVYQYSGHCHTPPLPGDWQMHFGPFVDYVNQIFHDPVEPWMPF